YFCGTWSSSYQIVRQVLRVGTENYSLKSIECLYRGKRETDIATAGESIVAYHRWIESPDGGTWQTSKILKEIRDYNRDDCVSTRELDLWLSGIQAYCGIKYVPPTLSRKAEEKPEDTATL